MAYTGRVVSGARARLIINGKVIGFATGVNISENIALQPVDVLGEIDPVEYEPLGRTVMMNCTAVRIKASSFKTLGVIPRGDTVEIVNMAELDALIEDVVTGDIIMKVSRLKAEAFNARVDTTGIMTMDVSFRGIRVFDEEDAA